MDERYSHPGTDEDEAVVLEDHLAAVANRTGEVLPRDDATVLANAPLEEVAWTVGYLHDLGKATTWFQDHIGTLEADDEGPTEHSALGAYAAYYALDRLGFDSQVSLAGLVAVYCHHQRLPDVADYVWEHATDRGGRGSGGKRVERVRALATNVDDHTSELASDILSRATEDAGTWEEFYRSLANGTLFDEVKSAVSRTGRRPDGDPIDDRFYDAVLQVWSALCLADKTVASGTPKEALLARQPSKSVLRSYVEELGEPANHDSRKAELDRQRSRARTEVLENVDEVLEDHGQVATLTLPTGLGKTLTGLDAAMTLRDETGRDRIVYALPFTSIVDQVAAEVSEIYGTRGADDLLTVHHHLADTVTEIDEDEEPEPYVEQLLGESWRSGLTVTTYVQLFESLAGPTNAQSLKLPALYDSVIVLDEPQSLPHTWWPLVNRLREMLARDYNAFVIGMTATQPGFFETESGTPPELADDPRRYFEEIERVRYDFHDSVRGIVEDVGPLDHGRAADEILTELDEGESVLCICNTIDSARTLSDALSGRRSTVDVGTVFDSLLRRDSDPDVGDVVGAVRRAQGDVVHLHLTSRLRPRDRLTLIQTASDLLEGQRPVVAVATQLVEAGVDVSFDRVFRDVAPLDSIVQAAGRCNRSFEQESGRVTIWRLGPPGEKELTPSEGVYNRDDESLLNVTWHALADVRDESEEPLSEADVAWKAVTEYFRILRTERNVGNRKYVEQLESAEARTLGEQSLIDERAAVDVLVARTEEEKDELDSIRSAWSGGEFDRVDRVLDEFRDRLVSVPIYDPDSKEAERVGALEAVHPDANVRKLDASSGDQVYFDPTTGLGIPDGVEHRFL